MKVGLDEEEIQTHGWAVTVFDALALLGKIEASLALQARALSGGLGAAALSAAAKTLDHYRQKAREPDTSCQRRRSSAIST